MKNFFYLFSAIIIAFAVMAAAGFYRYSITPLRLGKPQVVLHIPRGSSLNKVCSILKEEGIIRKELLFKILARLKGAEHNIKSGEYSIDDPIAPSILLDKLIHGKIKTHTITIPEGCTVFDIASILGAADIADPEAIIKKSFDPSFVKSLGINAYSLEGFLFPDTYVLTKDTPPGEILRLMTERFKEVYSEVTEHYPCTTNMSENEIITIASMVEKETARKEEKPVIASVFLNRISKGMRLECDPTVIYGIRLKDPSFHGRLRKKDLREATPYNTYRIYGLPPGPICNPGIESIKAVLNPLQTDFLYFVSKNDGTHKFSETLKEHNRAVYVFQKKHRKK